MSFWSRWIKPYQDEWNRTQSPAIAVDSARSLAGRKSSSQTDGFLFSDIFTIASPEEPEEQWRQINLDQKSLSRIPINELVVIMRNISPEISAALYFHIRMCNPGHTITACEVGTNEPNDKATAIIAAFTKRLDNQHGATSLIFTKLFIGQFMRGAALAELIIGKDGKTAVDLVIPDPISIRFKAVKDEERGTVWQIGQWQRGKWVSLDYPTIRHAPVDPDPGKPPYGHSLIAPAIFPATFLLGLMHDIRRVVSQQGYNRLDIEINSETLNEMMPQHVKGDPKKTQNFITNIIAQVQTIYAKLEPDDAYIHTDVIKLNKPVGTATSDSLKAIDSLIRGLERMVSRATKAMPLILGINEATTETHASFQWALQAASVEAMQHAVETIIERLFTIVINLQGVQADIKCRFAALDPQRALNAKTKALEIQNEANKYLMGWTSQDEGSVTITGHTADESEPRGSIRGTEALSNEEAATTNSQQATNATAVQRIGETAGSNGSG